MESKKFISIKAALETCYLEMNNAEKELIFTKLVNEAKQEGISYFELEIPNGISPKAPIKYRVELDRCVIGAFDKISFLKYPFEQAKRFFTFSITKTSGCNSFTRSKYSKNKKFLGSFNANFLPFKLKL